MLNVDASFIVVFFIVWILVLVLGKVFFAPLKRIRDKRQAVLRENRESARRTLETYDQTVQHVDQSLKAARTQAEQIRDSLSAEALKEKARLLEELNAEFRQNVDRAKNDLNQEVQTLKKEMDSRVEAISEKIEERLLE
jgi:F0F1-type ATP synthase membrane subunit b/b'